MADLCPIPVKKQRTDNSVESSDNEDLNLSRSFDEDYQILMDEEILKICKHPSVLIENFEINELLPDFISRCDNLLEWVEKVTLKSPFKSHCRCDLFLDKHEKISCIRKLFESPQFTNISSIANMMISNKPHWANEIRKKLDELDSVWKLKYLTLNVDLSAIVTDIKEDINDLQIWLKETKEKLSVQIDEQMEYNESIEKILIDFKVHDDISNSITKSIEKIIQMDSFMEYRETLSKCKLTLDELISQIHGQWLKAMELKYKLEFMPSFERSFYPDKNFGISLVGQESGFESEISPRNPIRGFPNSNLNLMKYISSSGECFADNYTTDLPMDSDSTELLDYNVNRSVSSSSSLVEMLDLPRHFPPTKNDVHVRKKYKRFKKKRHFPLKSIESFPENLTIEEKGKYLQNRNSIYRQSSSLKRRISETSTIQPVDETDLLVSKISDLAATAEKIVMRNDFIRRKNSISESPKESELDDQYGIAVSSVNDLNVKEIWDNYQASLYSNDDGDSQILEVEKIKDWEHDLETDDQDYESCIKDKTLQFLTSGYETSMEPNMHFCEKNLISILEFSASQQIEVNQQIETLGQHLNSINPVRINKINSIINEQLSISNTHVKLLSQILNSDPCGGNQNETLTKKIQLLQDIWENLIKKLIIIQLKQERIINSSTLKLIIESIDKIDSQIADLNLGGDLKCLKFTIEVFNEHKIELLNANGKIIKIHSDGQYVVAEDLNNINNRIDSMIEKICSILKTLNKDYEIMKACSEKIKESEIERKKIEIKLESYTLNDKSTDWKVLSNNMLTTIENCRDMLDRCMTYLSNISTKMCHKSMKKSLNEELQSLDELIMQLRLPLPVINNLRSKMDPFPVNNNISRTSATSAGKILNRLPVQVAIVVIIAIFGWCYKQQSSYLCQDSSDWFQLIRKYTNKLEPH